MAARYPWFPPLGRLYGAKSPVNFARDPHQGDIYDGVVCCRFPYHDGAVVDPKQPRGVAMVVQHPCDIAPAEKGAAVPWRVVCRVVEDRSGLLTLDGETHFYAFPLPDLRGDGAVWYADFRYLATVEQDWLQPERRIAVLSEEGWYAMQRRLAHYFTRAIIHWDDLEAVGQGLHPDAT